MKMLTILQFFCGAVLTSDALLVNEPLTSNVIRSNLRGTVDVKIGAAAAVQASIEEDEQSFGKECKRYKKEKRDCQKSMRRFEKCLEQQSYRKCCGRRNRDEFQEELRCSSDHAPTPAPSEDDLERVEPSEENKEEQPSAIEDKDFNGFDAGDGDSPSDTAAEEEVHDSPDVVMVDWTRGSSGDNEEHPVMIEEDGFDDAFEEDIELDEDFFAEDESSSEDALEEDEESETIFENEESSAEGEDSSEDVFVEEDKAQYGRECRRFKEEQRACQRSMRHFDECLQERTRSTCCNRKRSSLDEYQEELRCNDSPTKSPTDRAIDLDEMLESVDETRNEIESNELEVEDGSITDEENDEDELISADGEESREVQDVFVEQEVDSETM